ncbi:Fc.00g080170.m01.CDS01 [Cosmosporella sp. VM-42]
MEALGSHFERVDLTYKTLNGISFTASIFVPNSLQQAQKTSPLLVHFHGGGLVMGTNPEPHFLSRWALELTEAEGAIMVSPAYRLLPEAKGSDILEDLKDFWAWVRGSLPTLIAERWPGLSLDLGHTAVCGESAGGYLSIQSAILFPEAEIKAVLAQYPAMHPDISAWSPDPKPVADAEANALIDKYVAEIKPGAIRVSSPFPVLVEFMIAILKTGRYPEILGDDKRLTLGYGLREAGAIPPVWVMQGTSDQIMPKAATDELVAKFRELRAEVPLLYSVQPGDHGFDGAHGLEEPYIAEGIADYHRLDHELYDSNDDELYCQ